MLGLPLDERGFPVPWFVKWIGGKPVFPAMDRDKMRRAWDYGVCWVCGSPLGRFKTFVIGPMCCINRVSAEPPSHLECARFAARNCPFLANPRMRRVPVDKWPSVTKQNPAGIMLDRNPGVTLLWTSKNPSRFVADRIAGAGKGWLFEIGDPVALEWFAEGRPATRAEVVASIESGVPALEATIAQELPAERPAAKAELDKRIAAAFELVPA